MSEENEELDINAEEENDCIYVYGICMSQLPEGLQPLECIVLIEGIMMDTGQPTITAMGSEGIKPWAAAGMLRMEANRLEHGYIFSGHDGFDDDDEDEDEDENYD